MNEKFKVIWIGGVILIILSLYFFLFRDLNPVSVKAMTLNSGDLKVTVTATATGTVKAEDEMKVSSQRTGRIIRLNFEEGDNVKAGDVIAELDSREAEVHLRQVEGELRASEARLSQTKVNLEDAERSLKRIKSLYKDGLVSEQDVDTAQKSYDLNSSLYEASLASLKGVRASLDLAKIQFDYSFIKAPITGVISQRPVEIGDTVLLGSPVATIVQLDRIYVKATIDEVDVGRVFVGQPVEITIDAFPERVFEGKVIRVSPIVLGVKQETRTFEVRVGFTKREERIKPGMSADIEIITDALKGILFVPANTVIERKGKKMVYIIEGRRARLVPVEIGLSTWDYIEIKKGLKEGDRIITNPDATGLKDGSRVEVGEV
jgi:RND family efflux transporter MFP subunit